MKIFVTLFLCTTLISECLANFKIINGVLANPREFGSFVVIKRIYHGRGSILVCGGTILTPIHILTAAHCIYSKPSKELRIHYGVRDAKNPWPHNTRYVIDKVIHEKFKTKKMYCDIGIIIINGPIMFDKFIQPVRLPKLHEPIPEGSTAIIIGYGAITPDKLSDTLQVINDTIINQVDCNRFKDNEDENIFCTLSYGKSSCSGDSGGPLYVDGIQIGITSFGIHECVKSAAAYTKVSSFVDWIDNVIDAA